jgi:hypothetical protein
MMFVGEKAELLYVRGLAFCAETLKDGLITDRQVVNVIGFGMRDARARADRLVAAGLWERDEEQGGYIVTSWLTWNLPADSIRARMDADAARKGAHK